MGDITLRKALDDYKNVYMPYRNFAERTRVEYSNDLEDLVEFLEKAGIKRVESLGLPIFERYVADLENRGYASLTRKRKVVTIRSFLSFLYQEGHIGTNIAQRLILPYAESTVPNVLTEAEYNRLRKVCEGNPRDAAIVELLLQTGIRLSELTRLTLDDIELRDNNSSIRIRSGRGKDERTIPLITKASEALEGYLADRPSAGRSILFLNRFEKPLGNRGVQKMLGKYLKLAKIGRASINTLRHTFGAQHIAKGTRLKTVKGIMGLKDVRSTLVYQTLAKEIISKELQEHAV